jgi:predicted DsbA family dithiol-disulfide isomerase
MELDLVIDVVCPWCFIGKRQLDKAMAERPGAITAVRYRPYQLAPDAPASGVDRTAYYEKKFGKDSPQLKAAREHMLSIGPGLGIAFDFESDCIIGNSMDAHRLIRWALTPGVQDRVADAVMCAYFEDCRNVADRELLADIAAEAGMDRTLVTDLLASGKDTDLIAAEVAQAQQAGIRGVPMFIFDGKHAVSGAQEAAVLVQVMDRIAAGDV